MWQIPLPLSLSLSVFPLICDRSILLAERGGGLGDEEEVEVVVAEEGFQVFATMNPGGDFGKKEVNIFISLDAEKWVYPRFKGKN